MSSSETSSTPSRRRPVHEFFVHLVEMPRSHKIVLTVAVVLVICGVAGVVTRRAKVETTRVVSNSGPTPTPGRGIVSSDSAPTAATPAPAPAPPPPTLTERLSPTAIRSGLGLIGGFIIGWAFRAFLKMMAMITFLVGAIFIGLSYFNVLNVDFSAAETKFKTSSEWVSDQASRAKDAAMSHIPGSAASVVGLWLGFRRK
jgi:uncharacterized membrane protein (Fun14 family)